MSGAYDIGTDGALSLPMLGRVPVAGQSLHCIEAIVAHEMFSVTGGNALINASFEYRQPVVVRGAVRAPGAYTFSPGLTVEKVLALSGAQLDGGIQDAQRYTALIARETEIRKAALGVLIERRRTEAALAGSPVLRLSPEEEANAIALLGQERVASEQVALEAELASVRSVTSRNRTELKDLNARIIDTKSTLEVIQAQLVELGERRNALLELKERGYGSVQQLDQISVNMMSIEREALSFRRALLELVSARNISVKAEGLANAERNKTLSHQIRNLAEEETTLLAQLATVRAEVALAETAELTAKGVSEMQLAIDRPSATGTDPVAADMDTRLMPGDMLTVTILNDQTGKIAAKTILEDINILSPIEEVTK